MIDRILFWLDIDPCYIGIANFLQKKYPAEYFSIVNINEHGNLFYKDQKFVNFKKQWFYRDHIDVDKDADLDYLKTFEKKYCIDLWKILFTDRRFYLFNKYYNYDRKQLLSITEQACRLFETILNEVNPNFLIMKPSDEHENELLVQLCKAKGISILTFGFTRFGYRSIISPGADKLDDFLDLSNYSGNKSFEELQKYIFGFSDQADESTNKLLKTKVLFQTQVKNGIKFLKDICNNNYRNYYYNFGRTRLKVIKNEGSRIISSYFKQKFVEKNFSKSFNPNDNYVYFPLNVEPERSLLNDAPYYTNQIEVIRIIAKSIPINYKLIVKDHPMQILVGMRKISFYKQIMQIPNVEFIHHLVSNEELIKHCKLVIAINGAGPMEAAFFKKPSICFAEPLYTKLPSVFKVENLEDLPKLIRNAIDTEVKLEDINAFVSCIEENSFEFDYYKFYAEAHRVFYYNGNIEDVKIPETKMLSFMESFKKSYELIVSEFIKKIELIKEQKI